MVGIISVTINKSRGTLVENVSGFDKYTTARNISHTGVNVMLRYFDKRDTAFMTQLKSGYTVWKVTNIMAGQCSVSAKLKHPPAMDTLDITSRSRFMDSTYTMSLRLKSYPKPFPNTEGAMNIASVPFGFSMNGNTHIYGENYNMNGSRGSTTYDTYGVAVPTAPESTTVSNGSGGRITGVPKPIGVTAIDNPLNYVQEYINGADIVFSGSNNQGNYGSATNPVIGYCNGNIGFKGNGSFYGVMIVHGSVDFGGTFDMYGLVIAYGDSSSITLSASKGTPQIYGAMIATGPPGSSFTMAGTADMQYSAEALAMAKGIGYMQAYKVIWWYE